MLRAINRYIGFSYRRKLLDKLQQNCVADYHGVVLDIGGRERGYFKKPKEKVEKWIVVDIQKKNNPDLILDVANMDVVPNESIDVINAIELFEHVEKIDEGLNECFRVLKTNGKMIFSVPFMYPFHADPFDFQRWTLSKWEGELTKIGFKIKEITIMGSYFTILCEMLKTLFRELPFFIKYFTYFFFPLFDLLIKLDNTKLIINHPKLGKYHGGYFFKLEKIN